MTDPTSTALRAPGFALGDGGGRVRGGRRARAGRGMGHPPVRPRRDAVVERCARRRGHRRAARLARCPGRLRGPDRRARGLRRRRRRRPASRPPSWPGWAAAASRRTCSTGPSGSQEGYLELRILDSTDPAARGGRLRRPRSAQDAGHHRHQVGHDDRAQRVPGRLPGTAPTQALDSRRPPRLRDARRDASRRSPTRARASRRSPTTTSSARSSSTRPTSAAATRR